MGVSDDHLRALGRITEKFATLEFTLDLYIRILLGLDDIDIGYMVAAQLAFRGKVDLVRSLFAHKYQNADRDERIEELQDLLGAASSVKDNRNRIVHSTWIAMEDNPEIALVHKKSLGKKGYQQSL